LIEVKTNADLRLYTTKILKNIDGKYLVIFDKKGNHETINKVVNLSSLKIIDCDHDYSLPNVLVDLDISLANVDLDLGYYSDGNIDVERLGVDVNGVD
jgi:hypothetical protein